MSAKQPTPVPPGAVKPPPPPAPPKPRDGTMRSPSLFDDLEDERRATEGWVPDEPPQIASRGVKHIVLNFETTGLRWWDRDRPLAASVCFPDGTARYISWGHRGGNIAEETARRWAQRELRDLHIENINTRFDVHQGKTWGIDLEAQNCTVSDISHYAALLDDHRKTFSLDQLIRDLLGEEPMARLDESRMVDYHAEEAAPRAKYNAQIVRRLHEVMWPRIVAEDLERVVALESKVIYPVCEMERNGVPIDLELLDHYLKASKAAYERCLYDLIKLVGFQVDPGSPTHRKRLFEHLKLPLSYLGSGRASFTDAITKEHEHIPAIALLRQATKIASIRSKYLLKYQKNADSNGIIRYALHQLRAQKDELSDYDTGGTVTGRFSSSALTTDPDGGINIQQVMKASKQRVAFGYEEDDNSHDDEIYIIRRLHVPPSGRQWMASDAMQEEYRIFASYVGNPAILAAYRENPLMSFHKYMWARVKRFKPDQTYRQQKDLNFAYIYGAGMLKQALMLGHITKSEYDDIKKTRRYDRRYDHPRLEETREVRRIYEQEIPEVKNLLALAAHIAKPVCDKDCFDPRNAALMRRLHDSEEHRGYVRTILGRRSRFPNGNRLHKAFNSIDQGSGADIMKQKIIELHEDRHRTGLTLRYTVHDELDGDIPQGADGEESLRLIHTVLNQQSFPQLKVPILWEVSSGPTWADCKETESEFASSDAVKSLLGIHDSQDE